MQKSSFRSRNPLRQNCNLLRNGLKTSWQLTPLKRRQQSYDKCRQPDEACSTQKSLSMSQTVIIQQCYGAIHQITCQFFIHSAPGTTRKNLNEKSKSSSNVVPTRSHLTTPLGGTDIIIFSDVFRHFCGRHFSFQEIFVWWTWQYFRLLCFSFPGCHLCLWNRWQLGMHVMRSKPLHDQIILLQTSYSKQVIRKRIWYSGFEIKIPESPKFPQCTFLIVCHPFVNFLFLRSFQCSEEFSV